VDFKVTHQKVTELIAELREWERGEDRHTGNELMTMFDLERDVVERVAESEDIDLHWVDPNASTLDLDPDEVKAALVNPDPNPRWVDEDRDTGVWKKDTGEWTRIGEKPEED